MMLVHKFIRRKLELHVATQLQLEKINIRVAYILIGSIVLVAKQIYTTRQDKYNSIYKELAHVGRYEDEIMISIYTGTPSPHSKVGRGTNKN